MDIKIPNLGEGADTGTVVSIHVKEGDSVRKDQTLLELENEKAVAPIPSTTDGVVAKILVKVGDKVSVGQSIVSLTGGSGTVVPEAPKAAASSGGSARPASSGHAVGPAYDYITPTVRARARELGMDPAQYLQSLRAPSKPPAESVDFSKWGPVRKEALTSLRQKIAQKMSESWTTIPHVTQFDDVDITALMELRKKYEKDYFKKNGSKLTLTSFVLKACVTALQKHPNFNASLDENTNEMVYKDYYHLGVAVDTEQGLIVPVLKDVDKKSLLEISKGLEELAEKTRARKVSLDDLKGGTFTVSNLGGIGGGYFTPIINKPEVAILGTSRGKKTADGKLVMPIAVSYDHRVIDGADGARFIRTLAEALEQFPEKDVQI